MRVAVRARMYSAPRNRQRKQRLFPGSLVREHWEHCPDSLRFSRLSFCERRWNAILRSALPKQASGFMLQFYHGPLTRGGERA